MPVLERPPGPPKLASLELFSFPRGFKSSSVDWRRGEGDLWNTGDLTSMPALMGEVLEALMLLAEGPDGGRMNETSVIPAESSWSLSATARSSSTSIGSSDTAYVELAPAGRREGDDGVVGDNDGLFLVGLLDELAGAGLSRPALSSLVTNTIVSFIPSLAGTTVGGRLEMHS